MGKRLTQNSRTCLQGTPHVWGRVVIQGLQAQANGDTPACGEEHPALHSGHDPGTPPRVGKRFDDDAGIC